MRGSVAYFVDFLNLKKKKKMNFLPSQSIRGMQLIGMTWKRLMNKNKKRKKKSYTTNIVI